MFPKKSTKDLVRSVHGATGDGDTPPIKEPAHASGIKKERTAKEPKAKGQKKEPGNRPPIADVLKSKAFLGGASIALALVLAFVVVPMMQAKIAKVVAVVTLGQDVPRGTCITAEMLALKDMGSLGLPNGILYDASSAVGKYTTVAAVAGDLLTASRLAETYPSDDPALAALPNGLLAMSASFVDQAQSVSSKVRAGDVIQLFAVYPKGSETTDFSAVAIPELTRVEVLAVTNSDAGDVTAQEAGTETAKQIATMTIAVDEVQAAVLAGLNTNATLHAALAVRGDEGAKSAALLAQADYMKTREAPLPATTDAPPPSASPVEVTP